MNRFLSQFDIVLVYKKLFSNDMVIIDGYFIKRNSFINKIDVCIFTNVH